MCCIEFKRNERENAIFSPHKALALRWNAAGTGVNMILM
jgi:hypothetical protein